MEGLQRKIRLYCLGGTYLVLSKAGEASKDLDFMLSREDFRALSGLLYDLETKDLVRVDLFPDGQLPGFKLADYEGESIKLPVSFDHIEIYLIALADFVLTKAISGRSQDYEDIKKVVISRKMLPKAKLLERFKHIRIEKGKEEEIQRRFMEFIEEFYKD